MLNSLHPRFSLLII